MAKKVMTIWLGGCSGCHISLLDLHEKLLSVFSDGVELVYSPPLLDFKEIPEHVDVALVEGGIRNEDNVEEAEEVREAADVVIAVGTCACFGGIPGLANLFDNEELLERAYVSTPTTVNEEGEPPSEDLPELTWRVHPLSDVIDVDVMVPGCPPSPEDILEAVRCALEGEEFELPRKSVCDECPREKKGKVIESVRRPFEGEPDPERCLLEQGYPCLGPATRAGCGGRCPEVGVPCAGCRGPAEGSPDQGAGMISALASAYRVEEEEEPGFDPVELAESVPDPVGWFYRFSLPSALIPFRADRGEGP